MAVGDRDDGSSSRDHPLSTYHSFSRIDPQMPPSASELPLHLPQSNQTANLSEDYSLNQYLPSLHDQQQPKQSVSSPLSPKLSATSPSASTHSSSATAIPATGGLPGFKDEETCLHPAVEIVATGGRAEFEDEADGAVGTISSYEVNEFLKSKPALEVIEMGFLSEVVKTVIHIKVAETGEDYLTTEALLDAVIAYQIAMNDDDSQRNEESSSNSLNSPSHQNTPLENVCPQNLSASNTTQQGDKVVQRKKKGKIKSPRNGMTTAMGNQQLTTNKSSELQTDGENLEKNSSALSQSQMLSPFLLKEENKKMKSSRLCKICVENEVQIVFLPCGHLVCCAECSSLVQNCNVCHRSVKGSVKVFLA